MTTFAGSAFARRLAAPASATLGALALLSACGGGGGGGGGGDSGQTPTPPAATVAITSASTSTASAGAAIPLHATVSSSDTPTWTLSGPGSLSATTGTDVTYTPPDAESLAQAATATVTASADGASGQIAIAVAVGSVAGQHWDTSHAALPSWNAVAFDSGTFVAVGSSGGLRSSADGLQWTPHDTAHHAWTSVAHGAAGWVAVAVDGGVATSADGAQWSVEAGVLPGADATTAVTQVVFGDGVYVVGSAGSGSWVSTDGVSWTAVADSFVSLAFGGGTLVAVDGAGQTLVSTNGQSWTPVDAGAVLGSVAHANGLFLANSGGQLARSVDGRTWAAGGTTPYASDPVLSSGDAFYQSGSTAYRSNGNVYTLGALGKSTDGQAWSYRNQSAVGIASGLAQDAGTLVVVSRDGSIGAGPDVDHLQAAMARSNGYLSSADHVHGRYVALSADGDLLSSADGRAWSAIALADAAWPGASASYVGTAMAHAASGRLVVNGFVRNANGGADPAILYSDDEVAWHVASLPAGMLANTVMNDGTRFLAFSNAGVYTSDDGSVWTLSSGIPVHANQWITKAVHGHGLYIAVGYGGLVAISADAVHWTVAPVATDGGQAQAPLNLSGIVDAGDRFVAVGVNGRVVTSADGQSWSTSASATQAALRAIAVSAQGELVAVGDGGAIETSVDGLHWTLRASPADASLHDVTFADGAFLAVGEDSVIEMSSH